VTDKLRTADLERRCNALRDAVSARGMGKSHLMHIAARQLAAVAELLGAAQEIDGTDQAAENRRLSDLYLQERAAVERLREERDPEFEPVLSPHVADRDSDAPSPHA
jgi:hypothetical protein